MSRGHFNKKAAKPKAYSRNALIEAVGDVRPDLKDQPVLIPSQGRSAHVILYEYEAFKAPRCADDLPRFQRESRIFEHLQARELPIPEMTCKNENPAFFGMERLHGIALERRMVSSAQPKEQQKLANDIAKFMQGLDKAFDANDKQTLLSARDMAWLDHLQPIETLKDRSNYHLFEHVAATCVEEMLTYEERTLTRPKVAVHNDLNEGNILVDPKTRRLEGILDFDSVSVSVPEASLMGLRYVYGRDFTEKVCKAYSKQTGQDVTYYDVARHCLAFDICYLPILARKNDEQAVVAVREDITDLVCELRAARVLQNFTSKPKSGPKAGL